RFRITLDICGLLLFQNFEISELIQAQDAVIPQLGVEHVALIEKNFAADYLIARGGVAREIDAADEELLAFIGGQGEIDLVATGLEFKIGLGDEIDITEIAIQP